MAETTRDVRPRWDDPEWQREMRDRHPVWQDPDTGSWHVFRYADVAAVQTDHQTFSSDFGILFPGQMSAGEGSIAAMDPPRHDELRRLVSRSFAAKAIARLESGIADVISGRLDAVAREDRWELTETLAHQLPMAVIAELLGIPAGCHPQFTAWGEAMLASALFSENGKPHLRDPAVVRRAAAEIRKFHGDLRADSSESLLTTLAQAELDDVDLAGLMTVILQAGHEATGALLSNSLLCLDEHPESAAELRADPGKLPSAVEEVIRYRTPFQMTARVTTRETELGGRVIPAKTAVTLWLAAANRDERQFARPDEFVIDRSPNAHLGFGRGVHFCLGAVLARLQIRVTLRTLLHRYETIRVDRTRPLEWRTDPGANTVKTLHLRVA